VLHAYFCTWVVVAPVGIGRLCWRLTSTACTADVATWLALACCHNGWPEYAQHYHGVAVELWGQSDEVMQSYGVWIVEDLPVPVYPQAVWLASLMR
jgi:hypothetical protein